MSNGRTPWTSYRNRWPSHLLGLDSPSRAYLTGQPSRGVYYVLYTALMLRKVLRGLRFGPLHRHASANRLRDGDLANVIALREQRQVFEATEKQAEALCRLKQSLMRVETRRRQVLLKHLRTNQFRSTRESHTANAFTADGNKACRPRHDLCAILLCSAAP